MSQSPAQPCVHINDAGFYAQEHVDAVIAELHRKAMAVKAGIAEFTATDRFAYAILQSQGHVP